MKKYLLARTRAMRLVRPLLEKDQAATSILDYGEVAEYVKSLPPLLRTKQG